MTHAWEADPSASFERRLGKSAAELQHTNGRDGCPELWELDNGDIAVIGRDLTEAYQTRLPDGVTLRSDERLVVLPGSMLSSAKPDIRDARA